MHIHTQAIQCMITGRRIPGPDQARKLYSQLYELSPLAACVMQFILLAYMVRCDHVDKEQFYKIRRARRHHEVDTSKALPRSPWIYLEVLCAPTLPASFQCALASNACNWGSSGWRYAFRLLEQLHASAT